MEEFITYWDEVIRQWGESGGKVLNPEQKLWFDNKSCLINDCIPEPYGGNPKHCSAVVINYNPGLPKIKDGDELYCHISQLSNPESMPGQLYKKYSKFAIDFPWLNKNIPQPAFLGKCKDSIDWLIKRKEWVNRIVGENETKLPFFIDVCGWHSRNWNGVKLKTRKGKTPIVTEYLEKIWLPMVEKAIENSDLQVGLCVGAQFDHYLLPVLGFKKLIDRFAPIKNKSRWYSGFIRNNTLILCTWSRGSNNQPSKEFAKYEIKLIEKLKHKARVEKKTKKDIRK